MTTSEAAAALNVTERRIRQLILSGELPATRHGRDWWIEEEAIAAFERKPVGYPKGKPRKESTIRTNVTIFKDSTFKALAKNDDGASYVVGNEREFSSVRQAVAAARAEMGSGWKIEIIDNYGRTVEQFRIR